MLLFVMLFNSIFCMGKLNAQTQVTLMPIEGKVNSPVAMENPSDGSKRAMICEQRGVIRILKAGKLLDQPFLDIQHRIVKQMNMYSERGLLGLAFDPDYKNNRTFYVYYSAASKLKGSNHKSIIAQYVASASNPDLADPSSERIIMEIEQPESNHNGGQMAFGQDGYLYIGLGDGGGANDEHGKIGNGQNLETLLGKIIRIDVHTTSGYRIPKDNPFVNKPGRDEIWAYGLRNPWKFSFDPQSGTLFCADVGQDTYEEVDIIEKGGNYGWRVREGKHCFNSFGKCNHQGMIDPIAEYSHQSGKSIIGGYLYRGDHNPLKGKYIFADWTGKLFMLSPQGSQWIISELKIVNAPPRLSINSMGRDEDGSLYILGQKGFGPDIPAQIFRLEFKEQ